MDRAADSGADNLLRSLSLVLGIHAVVPGSCD